MHPSNKTINTNADTTASISRKFWASLYELALLFGISVATAIVVQTILSITHIQLPSWMHSVIFFLVNGAYFVYCWTQAGQTLAQRTWHLKVSNQAGELPNLPQATLRYLFAYIGIMPAMMLVLIQMRQYQPHEMQTNIAAVYGLSIVLGLINWMALLGTALIHPKKQTLHERWSNTQTHWVKK